MKNCPICKTEMEDPKDFEEHHYESGVYEPYDCPKCGVLWWVKNPKKTTIGYYSKVP